MIPIKIMCLSAPVEEGHTFETEELSKEKEKKGDINLCVHKPLFIGEQREQGAAY